MRILEAGKSSSHDGFTFLEIMIVLLIRSLMFGLTLSGLESGFLRNDRKLNLRLLQDLFNEIRYTAVLQQKTQHLMIQVGGPVQSLYWVASSEQGPEQNHRKKPFLQGSDQLYGLQKTNGTLISSGVADIAFLPQGLAEECTFFLQDAEAVLAVTLQAVSPRLLTEQVDLPGWQP